MAFYESPRFPTTLARDAEGGPEFMTDIAELSSGFESRNAAWDMPRERYVVSLVNRPKSEFDTLKAFFLVMRGAAHGFRFRDHYDYSTTSTTGLLGTGVGTGATTYQMVKRYQAGSTTFDRKIVKPVSGKCTIYKNAVAQTLVAGVPAAGQVSIDFTTGIVTWGTAPGGGDTITWAGEFDVPVRFDADWLSATRRGGIGNRATWDQIVLKELRL
jgi:uncharacterized protein (TIGR02217 family)